MLCACHLHCLPKPIRPLSPHKPHNPPGHPRPPWRVHHGVCMFLQSPTSNHSLHRSLAVLITVMPACSLAHAFVTWHVVKMSAVSHQVHRRTRRDRAGPRGELLVPSAGGFRDVRTVRDPAGAGGNCVLYSGPSSITRPPVDPSSSPWLTVSFSSMLCQPWFCVTGPSFSRTSQAGF